MGDRHLHQFVLRLSVQGYPEAVRIFKLVVKDYLELRQIKTSPHFNRDEFSFHEEQDRQRLYLIRIRPLDMVNTFAANAAL